MLNNEWKNNKQMRHFVCSQSFRHHDEEDRGSQRRPSHGRDINDAVNNISSIPKKTTNQFVFWEVLRAKTACALQQEDMILFAMF